MNIYILDPESFDAENTIGFAEELSKISDHDFFTIDDPLSLQEISEKNILILDISSSITHPKLFKHDEIDETDEITALHDFNLGAFLRQCKDFNVDKQFTLISIPKTNSAEEIEHLKKHVLNLISDTEKEF